MPDIDISFTTIRRKNRARWAINHTCYKALGGFWCAIYRRSYRSTWNTYQKNGQTLHFATEKEARDYLEQKRIEAMR